MAEPDDELRAARLELALAQERLASLVSTSIEMVLCLEYDPPVPVTLPPEEQSTRLFDAAIVALVNDSAAGRFAGRAASDVVGRRLAEVAPPRTRAVMVEQFREFASHGHRGLHADYVMPTVDGEPTYVEVNRHASIVDGRIVRSWHMSRDVTPRKRAERELQESSRQLEHARKLESLGLLAGGIAHDFNNLLAIFAANLDVARRDVARGRPADAAFAAMDDALARARDLTRRVLVFSRPEQEQRREALSLAGVALDHARMARPTLPGNVRLETRIAEDAPRVTADATQMHQVVMNLVQNAVHASEPRGGVVTITVDAVPVAEGERAPLRAGRYARLVVRDEGIGMDGATRERIFDPFFTTKPRGTGLGLSVVHRIVAAHGGAIAVRSEPDRGAELEVLLPALDPEPTAEAPAAPSPPAPVGGPSPSRPPRPSRPDGDGVHVLFVDDEPRIAELTAHVLVHHGFRVTVRTSPALALEAFRANADDFDLVVTDEGMPGMTGVELAERVTAVRPGIPVLLASGQAEPPPAAKLRRAGIVGVLPKPFPISLLAERIRAAIGARVAT
jgi:PAS domain S-box-containing protein